ncbi:MAG: isoprenylcysteine carboxyl methyltransferase [Deltaproteobacteria bacterium]|nr:isoprenylcysteine carboxyl methyltransferase [Deltaproteobacteria bacterium]
MSIGTISKRQAHFSLNLAKNEVSNIMTDDKQNKLILRRVFQVLLSTSVWGGILLLSAGQWNWPRGWLCLGFYIASFLVNFFVVFTFNPQVIAERAKAHEGTKTFDKIFGAVFLLLVLTVPVVAGLDMRFQWTNAPFWLFYPGLVLFVLGNIPIVWSMVVNQHLEQTVRIQEDRDHKVVTTGPYAWVRHPMYVGMILEYLGLPLMLGSHWSLVPAGLAIVAMIVRTYLEDQTLQEELPGYKEFTRKTKFRLLPGIF